MKRLLLALIFILAPYQAHAAISVVTDITSDGTGSFSMNMGSAANRVFVIWSDSPTGGASGITVGGNAVTQTGSNSTRTGRTTQMWFLKNPPTGSQTVSGTYGNVVAIVFGGVDQTTPIDAVTQSSAFASGATMSNTASVTGTWGFVGADDTSGNMTFVFTNGGTTQPNFQSARGTTAFAASGAQVVTMTFTGGGQGSGNYVLLRPAANAVYDFGKLFPF